MKNEEQKRAFKGVWIPREIWLNTDLTIQEKMLLTEIASFDNCFASNAHFAEFLSLSDRRVKQIISSLRMAGYIFTTEQRKGNYTVKRTITINKVKYYGLDGEESCPKVGKDITLGGEESCLRTNTPTNTTYKEISNSCSAKPNEKKSKFKFNVDQMAFAKYMFDCLKELNPNQKEPNLDSWANEIRLLNEIDKRDGNLINQVWEWARKDSFWQTNILSPAKLRKQFDALLVKSTQVNKPNGGGFDMSNALNNMANGAVDSGASIGDFQNIQTIKQIGGGL